MVEALGNIGKLNGAARRQNDPLVGDLRRPPAAPSLPRLLYATLPRFNTVHPQSETCMLVLITDLRVIGARK